MVRAVYSGTFDPITNGHLDIIKRATRMFSIVIIAVAKSEAKKPMFSLAERVKMAKEATKDIPNVTVKAFDNLLVDFCKSEDAFIIIRGLRAVSDFEYELQMGYANVSLSNKIETVYLMPSLQNAFISSSIVRTFIHFKAPFSHLVPAGVNQFIQKSIPCTYS